MESASWCTVVAKTNAGATRKSRRRAGLTCCHSSFVLTAAILRVRRAESRGRTSRKTGSLSKDWRRFPGTGTLLGKYSVASALSDARSDAVGEK